MTIYSTDNSEKKDLISDSVTVEIVCPEKKALTTELEDVPLDGEYSVYNDPVVPIQRQGRPEQRRICLQLCLFVGMLAGLTISILASLYLYKTMSYTTVRYRGKCGVGIVNMDSISIGDVDTPQPLKSTEFFEEDVAIDGNVETISVPKTKHSNSADITHDFDKNMTAIKDLEQDLCYLVPLLDSLLPSPIQFHSELQDMNQDAFAAVPEVITDYTICNGEDCYSGTTDNLAELCGEYKPLYARPVIDMPRTTPAPATTTGMPSAESSALKMIKTLDRMFRNYAGGDSVVTYHVYSYDDTF